MSVHNSSLCENMTTDNNHGEGEPTRRDVLRRTAIASTALSVGSAVSIPAAASSHCDVTVDDSGSTNYQTIQQGINNAGAGDTVCVEPGNYSGTVTVDKPNLTLVSTEYRGATITGGDSTTGSAVSIEADDVTVEGFEVSFPDGLLGVKIQSGYDGVTVRNNYVMDVGPVGRLGATGIIGGGPHENLTIERNIVTGITNEINETTPSQFSRLPTVNGIFVDDQDPGSLTKSTIVRNTVTNLRSDVASLGILLGIDSKNVTVENNDVSDVVADPGVDSDDTDDSRSYTQTFAQGLNVSRGTTDVAFRRNVVSDVRATFFVGTGLKIDGQADGLTVEFNDLLPTVGIENADSDSVTATCNYWGHPKGPREVAENRDADDGPNRQGRSAVVGSVEFEPWLVRSIENGENVENSCVGGRGQGASGN